MSLQVIVNGRPIDTYSHKGKTYIEGWKGSEYEIQYRNDSAHRIKIVVSVDGLNVVSGDRNWEKGYVVEPYQTLKIPGWRKDSGNVAKFVFSSVGKSYNQHNDSGNVANIGVIGCKIFAEKAKVQFSWSPNQYHYHYYYYPHWTPTWYGWGNTTAGINLNTSQTANVKDDGHSVNCSYTMDSFSELDSYSEPIMDESGFSSGAGVLRSMPQNSVGTGWGENKKFETQEVSYEFLDTPLQTILIYYDDRRGLERRGINLKEKYSHFHEPDAFPSDFGCPPPK